MASRSEAQVIFYGGAKGGGKTRWLIHEGVRYFDVGNRSCMIFRRVTNEIQGPGGLWEESAGIYPILGGVPTETKLTWKFPSGFTVKMAHLEHTKIAETYKGKNLSDVSIDEITDHEESVFWTLLSCQRSVAVGEAPKFRATMNPHPDSWVRKFVDWYLDPDGFPDPKKSGIVRWFGRVEGKLTWADSKRECQRLGIAMPLSFTFIASSIFDNKILLKERPEYLANLQSLPMVEQLRFLGINNRGGCWNVRPDAGDYFQRGQFSTLPRSNLVRAAEGMPIDRDIVGWFWACDLAGSAVAGDTVLGYPGLREIPDRSKNPDWSLILLLARFRNGDLCIWDVWAYRDVPHAVEWKLLELIKAGPARATVVMAEEPGQAGVRETHSYYRLIQGSGCRFYTFRPQNPLHMGQIASRRVSRGGVWYREGSPYDSVFWGQMEGFPDRRLHDDACSAFALAVMFELENPIRVLGSVNGGVYQDQGPTRNDLRARNSERTANDLSRRNDFRRLL